MTQTSFGAQSTADQVLALRDLRGRNILVTGASAGIGFETARTLASHGAHVLVCGRSAASAAETAQRIRAMHPQAELSEVALDLASSVSIKHATDTLPVRELHALICNAGLYAPDYRTTADGIESTVGVCHFGHFMLTTRLLDRLGAGKPARVVMVASEGHRFPPKLAFDRFPLTRERYRGLVAYGQAKLCNILFANELTRRHRADGIVANALHPGTLIATNIYRASAAAQLLKLVTSPFTKSIAQGAATSVYCATAPELERVGGRYFVDCQEKLASAAARDEAVARRLWELSTARIADIAG